MSIEKFPHLENKVPDVKTILDTPVQLVDEKKLWQLSTHFKDLQNKFHYDVEVVDAADIILSKIDNIVSLWNNRVSGEVMKASNNDNYWLAA